MRIMALDLGDTRIGIALSDTLKIIANGYETYTRKKNDDDFKYIADLIKEKEVDTVVLGLPVNMDGTLGDRADKTKQFAEKLKEYIDVKIVYQDERLTTVSAERALLEADMRRDKRKLVIDMVAATIILQSYMSTH